MEILTDCVIRRRDFDNFGTRVVRLWLYTARADLFVWQYLCVNENKHFRTRRHKLWVD